MHPRFALSSFHGSNDGNIVGRKQIIRRPLSPHPQDRKKRYGMFLDVADFADLADIMAADLRSSEGVPMIFVTPPTPLPPPQGEDDLPELDSTSSEASSDDDRSLWDSQATFPSAVEVRNIVAESRTPAEQIVNCYRAGMSLEAIQSYTEIMGQRGSDDLDDSESSLNSASFDFLDSESMSLAENTGNVILRIVDSDGLTEARNEAYQAMRQDGLGEQDAIACHRPDCNDTLPDVKALIFHLHIHNLHDLRFKCPQCNQHYKSRRELSMHACPIPTSTPTSPIKSMFSIFMKHRSA